MKKQYAAAIFIGF